MVKNDEDNETNKNVLDKAEKDLASAKLNESLKAETRESEKSEMDKL